MFRSFEIFRVLGIPVRVHSTLLFFLVVAGIMFGQGAGLAGILTTIIFLGLVFSFVLLHELGHAVVARANGVGVSGITLHPLGGVAALTHMPRDPKKEMAIAIAGPAVNFVLAGVFGAAYLLFSIELLRLLVIVNLVLGLFNLLHVPLGTILGVYTFWVLMQDESVAFFEADHNVTANVPPPSA